MLEIIIGICWIVACLAWIVVMGYGFWSWNQHTKEVLRIRTRIIEAYMRPRDGF